MYMYETHFLHIGHLFMFRPRVFSRALGVGARRGPACTLGASLGAGQALWAFKVARSGN